jgi:hypothetical protein
MNFKIWNANLSLKIRTESCITTSQKKEHGTAVVLTGYDKIFNSIQAQSLSSEHALLGALQHWEIMHCSAKLLHNKNKSYTMVI